MKAKELETRVTDCLKTIPLHIPSVDAMGELRYALKDLEGFRVNYLRMCRFMGKHFWECYYCWEPDMLETLQAMKRGQSFDLPIVSIIRVLAPFKREEKRLNVETQKGLD